MKSTALTAMMLTFALSTVACEKKEDCLKDAGCLAQARALAGPQLFPLAQSAVAGQVPTQAQVAAANQSPFKLASNVDAAIKAHSLKVKAAIKADDENPNSTYYKAPTPEVAQLREGNPAVSSVQEAAGRSTASVAPTLAADPGSSGEAAR